MDSEEPSSTNDFSSFQDEDAIFKAVRKQCLQSPLTTIPLALAAGTLLLTAAFSWGFLGVFGSVVLGSIGVFAFIYNLWIRGETLAKKHIRNMIDEVRNERRASLQEIQTQCKSVAFPEAGKEAAELSDAYHHYIEFLESQAQAKLGSAIGQRLQLAESARAAGAKHLQRAVEIHLALSAIPIDTLREELETWQKEHSESSTTILETKITAHSRQIQRYDKLTDTRDELVARSNELEAAIREAHLADAARPSLTDQIQLDDPAKRLTSVIEAAESAEATMSDFLRDTSETNDKT